MLQEVEQECPQRDCDSNRCYYTTRQTRSADEGETVFYTCMKCEHKFILNN